MELLWGEQLELFEGQEGSFDEAGPEVLNKAP